jgi:hypothetical protein
VTEIFYFRIVDKVGTQIITKYMRIINSSRKKIQHNMCWIPLYVNKHKLHLCLCQIVNLNRSIPFMHPLGLLFSATINNTHIFGNNLSSNFIHNSKIAMWNKIKRTDVWLMKHFFTFYSYQWRKRQHYHINGSANTTIWL